MTLLLTTSFLILCLSAVANSVVYQLLDARPKCLTLEVSAPSSSVRNDCHHLFETFYEGGNDDLYDTIFTHAQFYALPTHTINSDDIYILTIGYRQCGFEATRILRKTKDSHPNDLDFWANLWPTFKDSLMFILGYCIENNRAGHSYVFYAGTYSAYISIKDTDFSDKNDLRHDVAEINNNRRNPPLTLSNSSLSAPLPQSVINNTVDTAQDTILDIAPGPEADAPTLLAGICGCCSSCCKSTVFWQAVAAVGTVSALSAPFLTIWAQRHWVSPSDAQVSCTSSLETIRAALDHCQAQSDALLAALGKCGQ